MLHISESCSSWVSINQMVYSWSRCVDGMQTSELNPVTIQYSTSTHPPWFPIGHSYGHEWLTHILFVLCQSALSFLKPGYFKLWPWNYKVKLMGVGKGRENAVSPVCNWFAFFLFHINQITIPEIPLFWNWTLKNQRSRSWVRSKVEVT